MEKQRNVNWHPDENARKYYGTYSIVRIGVVGGECKREKEGWWRYFIGGV